MSENQFYDLDSMDDYSSQESASGIFLQDSGLSQETNSSYFSQGNLNIDGSFFFANPPPGISSSSSANYGLSNEYPTLTPLDPITPTYDRLATDPMNQNSYASGAYNQAYQPNFYNIDCGSNVNFNPIFAQTVDNNMSGYLSSSYPMNNSSSSNSNSHNFANASSFTGYRVSPTSSMIPAGNCIVARGSGGVGGSQTFSQSQASNSTLLKSDNHTAKSTSKSASTSDTRFQADIKSIMTPTPLSPIVESNRGKAGPTTTCNSIRNSTSATAAATTAAGSAHSASMAKLEMDISNTFSLENLFAEKSFDSMTDGGSTGAVPVAAAAAASTMTASELDKKLMQKRERNRIAARKCRDKKLNKIKEYETRVQELEGEIRGHEQDILKLNARKNQLRLMLINFCYSKTMISASASPPQLPPAPSTPVSPSSCSPQTSYSS